MATQQMTMMKGRRISGGANPNSGSTSCDGVDSLNDQQSSIRVSKSRLLARLDRLLRRWLPGYNFLRSCGGNSTVAGRQSPEAEVAMMPPLDAVVEPRSGGQTPPPPPLPPRRRRDGEVYLDAGIAKSEFCSKLERLLQAKLIDKD